MKAWCLSWVSTAEMGRFNLLLPWWHIGTREADGSHLYLAAALAEREELAKALVVNAYERAMADIQERIEWRICEERSPGWSPFSERLPRASWMQWPESDEAIVIVRLGEALTLRTLIARIRERLPYEVSDRDLSEQELGVMVVFADRAP